MLTSILSFSRYVLPIFAIIIFIICLTALLKRRPPSLGRAKLIDVLTKQTYPLTTRETSVGRSKNSDVLIKNATVSRLHAVIVCAKDGWFISDIRSQSGVLVNGKKIEKKAKLKTGDTITLGEVTFFFENLQEN